MKIVFLDVDGVLNSERFFTRTQPRRWGLDHLDPVAVERAQRIVAATGARVVISSTWRLVYPLDELREMLAAKGLRAPVLDRTPERAGVLADGLVRASEIASWLDANAARAQRGEADAVERFVILDDLDGFGSLDRFLVRTRFEEGLEEAHVGRAVSLLASTPGERAGRTSRGRYVAYVP